jgi:cytochrome c peroxidase
MFKRAFGENAVPQCYLVAQAIATFVRCFISGNSPYDRYTRGELSAMSESQIRGMNLFFSTKTNCSFCHKGKIFTDQKFHNTGTSRHYWDRGRGFITQDPNDYGLFLTPSLRNVEVTGPWMSDGNYSSLEEIVNNYNDGGKYWITKDPIIKPLGLSQQEKTDLVAFLKALTDHDFLNDKKFSDPFKTK